MASISKTKSSLFLALLAALILLMSRDVAARLLAETTTEKINKGEVATEKAEAKVGESKYYFGGNGNGGYYRNYGNGGNGNGGNYGPYTYGNGGNRNGGYYGRNTYGNGGNGNGGYYAGYGNGGNGNGGSYAGYGCTHC